MYTCNAPSKQIQPKDVFLYPRSYCNCWDRLPGHSKELLAVSCWPNHQFRIHGDRLQVRLSQTSEEALC
jgi:hypothetical protein